MAVTALKEKWFPPTEPTQSFSGKVVLVTGATGGLGYEAAKKLFHLNADKVILTARSQQRAEHAKETILSSSPNTAAKDSARILPLVLDMSTAKGVEAFVKELKATTEKLDAVILNAGVIKATYSKSDDGYEETIQVNAISTMQLAIELLPMLKESSRLAGQPSRLTIISSRRAPRADRHWTQPHPITEWSQLENFPSGMAGGNGIYARSKLLLEYSIRHLVQLPYMRLSDTTNGSVIVNSVCPGVCRSDLGREFKDQPLLAAIMPLFFFLLGKTAEKGANCYISALLQGPESVGQMWTASETLQPEFEAITSTDGKKLGDAVWQEMRQILLGIDPSLESILGTK